MSDLRISDLTIGYSAAGAKEYIDKLNAEAIQRTKDIMYNIEEIKVAFENGWVGRAQENYLINLRKSVDTVAGALDNMSKALYSQFGAIEEDFKTVDQNMVPLD